MQVPFRNQPQRAVLVTGALFATLLAAALALYLYRAGKFAKPGRAAVLFLGACSVLLLAIYFFWVSWYVSFPADILIWSEGDFLNDILKFSTGYPLYTAVANMDSTHYVPGPQLLTYLLAWLAGQSHSIPFYRAIQVFYTALAAFFALQCCRRILRLAFPESRAGETWARNVFWYAALFLMATNSITNRFAHNLHGDALAQLATMGTYYLLLRYVETRSIGILATLALLVPVDFLIKQNLLIWAVFCAVFLVVWDRAWKRAFGFTLAASTLFGATAAAGYALWGQPFLFWIFQELSKHAVSPLRSFQHVLDSWPYFAAGLLGGAAILRGRNANRLTGAWLIWLALISLEAYTSGIEWMLNHIGPGCLMAGVWFLAGLASIDRASVAAPAGSHRWIEAGAVAAAVALGFSGLGMIRIPLRPVSDDAYRYVADIEREFRGEPADRVLLDVGTWVYAKDRIVMGDRAPVAGMLGMANVDGFAASRPARREYIAKILVRDLNEPDFWYENALWPEKSGIRQALLNNYRETGHIRRAEGPPDVKNWAEGTASVRRNYGSRAEIAGQRRRLPNSSS